MSTFYQICWKVNCKLCGLVSSPAEYFSTYIFSVFSPLNQSGDYLNYCAIFDLKWETSKTNPADKRVTCLNTVLNLHVNNNQVMCPLMIFRRKHRHVSPVGKRCKECWRTGLKIEISRLITMKYRTNDDTVCALMWWIDFTRLRGLGADLFMQLTSGNWNKRVF